MILLVTGCAGFIGFHLTNALLGKGHTVVGIDNMNDLLYDSEIKFGRLNILKNDPNFIFNYIDLKDSRALEVVFNCHRFSKIIHLAAVPGVRYSFQDPRSNIENNILAFYNIAEMAVKYKTRHFIYASSSSVYGQSGAEKFNEKDNTDFPRSMYAATKKCNEMIIQALAWTHDLVTTGLRFFTVYGPWGRPDMAYYLFADKIIKDFPITVYQSGDEDLYRDFTYIDDIVEGLKKVVFDKTDTPGVYNIGRGRPVSLKYFIGLIENELGKKAIKVFKPMPLDDVTRTSADIQLFSSLFDWRPITLVEDGVKKFIKWFKYYNNL